MEEHADHPEHSELHIEVALLDDALVLHALIPDEEQMFAVYLFTVYQHVASVLLSINYLLEPELQNGLAP